LDLTTPPRVDRTAALQRYLFSHCWLSLALFGGTGGKLHRSRRMPDSCGRAFVLVEAADAAAIEIAIERRYRGRGVEGEVMKDLAPVGIALLLRETAWMGPLLALHLGVVFSLFLTMPYGRFVHGIYRYVALVCHAGERQAMLHAPAAQASSP
jgi:hypothetical protein